MVRGPRFELGTPRFSAGCLKRRRGHKSLRHNVGSSHHSRNLSPRYTASRKVTLYRLRINIKYIDYSGLTAVEKFCIQLLPNSDPRFK